MDYLEDMFKYLQKLGQFPQYASYQEYRKDKYGEDSFNSWFNGLPSQEQEDFTRAFGTD